jgi:hypothetical protein
MSLSKIRYIPKEIQSTHLEEGEGGVWLEVGCIHTFGFVLAVPSWSQSVALSRACSVTDRHLRSTESWTGCQHEPSGAHTFSSTDQCVKQTCRGSCPPVSKVVIGRDTAQRPPEACGVANFFLSYLVAITFPIEFDVWGRLCTHCEVAKVMTFAPVTQQFSL